MASTWRGPNTGHSKEAGCTQNRTEPPPKLGILPARSGTLRDAEAQRLRHDELLQKLQLLEAEPVPDMPDVNLSSCGGVLSELHSVQAASWNLVVFWKFAHCT